MAFFGDTFSAVISASKEVVSKLRSEGMDIPPITAKTGITAAAKEKITIAEAATDPEDRQRLINDAAEQVAFDNKEGKPGEPIGSSLPIPAFVVAFGVVAALFFVLKRR